MISECLVVEFQVTGDDCPLAEASRGADEPVTASPPLLRTDGNALLRFSTDSGVVGECLEADDRIRYLHRTESDDRDTFRCLSKAPCVLHELVDAGFLVESVQYRDGVERYEGAVVGEEVLRGVLEAAGGTVGVALERISPLAEDGETSVAGHRDLTPPQAEAIEAAHEMGYFEVPRGATAGEVAAEIGISKSAYLERLRRGQSAVFDRLIE